MEEKICQSCSMPILKGEDFGTNVDGGRSDDYCVYCYKGGKFVDDVSLEEYIEMNVPFYEQAGMNEEEMRKHCETVFPKLKRWNCTCTKECSNGYSPDCTCVNPMCNCAETN